MFGSLPRLGPWLYYVLASAFSFALLLTPVGTAGLMVAPAVAVLLMLLVVTREGWQRSGWVSLGLHRSGRSWLLLATIVPVAIFALGHLALWALPTFAIGATGAAPPGAGIGLAAGILGTTLVSASTTVLAEELGWRGYLLPRLTRWGYRRALVLSGFLHAVWHLPVILLTGLYHAHGDRWISVPLFVLVGTCGGVFMGYLRLRSGSLWPAVLAHAVHNSAWTFLGAFTLGSGATLELVAGERGLITAVGYLLTAGIILARFPSRAGAVGGDGRATPPTVERAELVRS